MDRSDATTPLVVDLDGTLVTTDLLVESLLLLAKQHPLLLLKVPAWLAGGRAHFKRHVAEHVLPDVDTLPYATDLLAYLSEEREHGRRLILASGADEQLARPVADKLCLFEEVYASDGTLNLSGDNKRDLLVETFGEGGFDYVGDSPKDLPVWRAARRAVLAQPDRGLRDRVAATTEVERVFDRKQSSFGALVETLRPHHWLKNILVFVPLAAAHRLYDFPLLVQAVMVFIAFSLCASTVYVINDLLDLPSDRHHPHKKDRPLASGRAQPLQALAMVPLLILLAAGIGLLVSPLILAILGFYLVLMLAYSQHLKDVAILDVMTLATGYTLRILAGAVAVAIHPSPWLIAFSGFLFFSLALTKRYSELMTMRAVDGTKAHARAYVLQDRELIAALGVASGHVAVVVLALYINSTMAHNLYSRYELIWLVCGLLLYWISHLWLIAHRGRMHDDPLVFALKDWTSRVLLILMGLVSLIAI